MGVNRWLEAGAQPIQLFSRGSLQTGRALQALAAASRQGLRSTHSLTLFGVHASQYAIDTPDVT